MCTTHCDAFSAGTDSMLEGHGKISIEEAMRLPLEYYEYVTPPPCASWNTTCES